MSQLSSNVTLKYSQAWKSECNCDSITMLISDILRSTVWRDSWTSDNILFSLSFSEDKISTMQQKHFLTNSPSFYGFLARAMFQATRYDVSVTVSECFVNFWKTCICFSA